MSDTVLRLAACLLLVPGAVRAQSLATAGALAAYESDLLLKNGYRVAGSQVFAAGAPSPLSADALFMALEDLKSRARMKALLEINMTLNKNNFSKRLPKEDLEALPGVFLSAWPPLPKSTREELRDFFSAPELADLDAPLAQPPPPQPPPSLPDVELPAPWDAGTPAQAGTLLPASSPALPSAPSTPDAAVETPGELLPLPEEGSVFTAVPAAPPPLAEASALVSTEPAPGAALQEPALALPAGAGATAEAGASAEALATSSATVSLSTPPAADGAEVRPEEFSAFLLSAPYDEEVKALLRALADHVRDPYRKPALNFLMRSLPHIVLDGRKASERAYAKTGRVASEAAPEGRPQIALNDGPPTVTRRVLLRSVPTRLPEAPGFYAALGLEPPALLSLSRENLPAREEHSDFGRLRVYTDQSLRLRYASEQMAGSLLEEIASAEALSRSAEPPPPFQVQFEFYRAVKQDTGKDVPLDGNLLSLYRDWLKRPEHLRAFILQSSPGTEREETERSLHALAEAGLLSGPQAQAALQALPRAPSAPPKSSGRVGYEPPSKLFACEMPYPGWEAFEERRPDGLTTHILGPRAAHGALRLAYHIHAYEKGAPGFIPLREMLAREKDWDAPGREAGSLASWRVSKRASRLMEVRESRFAPPQGLPSSPLLLHHFYAFVPGTGEDYFVIVLTTDERSYLDYRSEFKRFLKSFRALGY